jgi:hypothetical protein
MPSPSGCPNDVDRAASLVSLENENARTLRVLRIVFKKLHPLHASDNLPNQDTIGSEFVVAMA